MKNPLIYPLLITVILVISCGSGHQTAKETSITRVYESGDSHSILYDTERSQGNLLVTDPGSHYIILYQTSGNEWLIAEKSPARPGRGRVETTHHLFYIPERKHIDIETLHPALSSYGIWFEEENGNFFLVAFLKGSAETVSLPLYTLLKGELPEIVVPDQHKSPATDDPSDPVAETQFGAVKTNNDAVVLELMLGAMEHPDGEALVPFLTEDGLKMNRIISYTARNGKLYIVESIRFRVLVYDYEGNFLRTVNYPESLPGGGGKINVLDIATDSEFLYLLSTGDNAVYVIDAETGDIAAIIEEVGGQIAGPYTLKVVAPAGKELYSLLTSFWDGGGPITRRVVVTTDGEVFDAYYDGDAFRDLEEEGLKVTKLIVRRLK